MVNYFFISKISDRLSTDIRDSYTNSKTKNQSTYNQYFSMLMSRRIIHI